ncbi:MAG: hypothetical protein ACREIA_24750, partial [Opitutaceae bacterium]
MKFLSPDTLAETLDGGQCFRWRLGNDGAWRGISGSMAAELQTDPDRRSPLREERDPDRIPARPGRATKTPPPEIRATVLAGDPDLLAHHLADDID